MKKLQNISLGFILLSILLSITDLIIKYLIAETFEPGELNSHLNGWVLIGRIENLRFPLGFNGGVGVFGYAVIAIQVVLVMFFVRIQIREADKYFKYSSALIVFGWVGNYLDRLFFANDNWAYVHLDYFNLAIAGKSFINLSSLMILTGWILFIAVALLKFNQFIGLLRKSRSLSAGN
jgi:lipoprotein signal peptidase